MHKSNDMKIIEQSVAVSIKEMTDCCWWHTEILTLEVFHGLIRGSCFARNMLCISYHSKGYDLSVGD